jgi:XTP/dITP diphosphohydrolase
MMLKTIVIASKNNGKIEEIKDMLSDLPIEILSLNHYPTAPDVVENGSNFLENALIKAHAIADFTGMPVLADDSGLEVDHLAGEPGIFSARYAGAGATDGENNHKLLMALKNVPATQRGASFRCVLVLYWPHGEYQAFEGRWRGQIGDEFRGGHGFGYDPLFYLPEIGKTVAEITTTEKNKRSHRSQAVHELKKYLKSNYYPEKLTNNGA